MPYLPVDLPFPEPGFDARAFWAHCAERRLCFQACADCGRPRHPPVPCCPDCHSFAVAWVEAPAVGHVYSYTFVHHPAHPAVADRTPYNVALIEFRDLGGARLVSNVVDAGPGELEIGRPVTLVWEEGPGGQSLPRFRLEV